MKKLFYFVIGVLLVIPLSVKADMGAPMIRYVVVTPKSPSGAPCYGSDKTSNGSIVPGKQVGTIKYGDIVYYSIEEKFDGKIYADMSNYGNCRFIDPSDFKPVDGKNKNDIFVDTDLYKGRTFADLKVYIGPSSSYEQVGVINKYDEIKISNDLYYGTWVYVVGGGIEGYADIADGAAGYLANVDAVALIPSMKKYTDEIYTLDPWTKSYMLKDGTNYIEVYTTYTYIPNKVGISASATSDVELYDDVGSYKEDSNGKYIKVYGQKVVTVPKGSEATILGFQNGNFGDQGCLVSYNDVMGWMPTSCSDFSYDIPDDFIVNVYGDSEYYYKVGTAKVLDEADWEQIKNDEDIVNLLKDPNKDPDIDEPDPGDLPVPDIDDDGSKDSMSLRTIILLCALGGIVVVSTGIVILILINKKKKEKVKNINIEKESN